jgi:uncharacterized protein YutE (UPF0331/DUF86 family)
MTDRNIQRLSVYYNHLRQMQLEALELLEKNHQSLDSAISTRAAERYFQVIIDDIREIDNVYGKFAGVYSDYDIFVNKLTFLETLTDSELIKKIHDLGKVRNSIVHNPQSVESVQLKSLIAQLLTSLNDLIDQLSKTCICQHCKSAIVLIDGENGTLGEEATCPVCDEKSQVISVNPLIWSSITTNGGEL